MSQKIIIIRGNSGSGKSTVAKRVRDLMSGKVMFLQHDVLRRDILKVEDKEGNPVIGLIDLMARYGKSNGYNIVLEGILSNKKYGDMLRRLINDFDESHVYYFDIPFEETVRRHRLRPKNDEFGEDEMREWWKEKDYLGISGEKIMSADLSEDKMVAQILKDTNKE